MKKFAVGAALIGGCLLYYKSFNFNDEFISMELASFPECIDSADSVVFKDLRKRYKFYTAPNMKINGQTLELEDVEKLNEEARRSLESNN